MDLLLLCMLVLVVCSTSDIVFVHVYDDASQHDACDSLQVGDNILYSPFEVYSFSRIIKVFIPLRNLPP